MMAALLVAVAMVATSQGADLGADKRLDASVSLNFAAASIEAVLSELSSKINVPLEAAADLRQDLATLRVADRSTREVMERIANHFHWAWEAKEEGYRLYRPPEAQRAEEQAFRKQLLEPYFEAQDDARLYLAYVAGADTQAMMTRFKALWRRIGATEDAREQQKLLHESWDVRPYVDGEDRLAALVLLSLTEEDFAEIESVGKIVMSSRPTRAQRPLPDAALRELPTIIELTAALSTADEEEFDPARVRAVRVTIEGVQEGLLRNGQVWSRIDWLGSEGILRTVDAWPGPPETPSDEDTVAEQPRRLPREVPPAFRQPWKPPADIRRNLVGMTSGFGAAGGEYLERLVPGLVELEPLEPLASSMLAAATSAEVNLIADAYDTHIFSLSGQDAVSFATTEGFFEAAAHALDARVTLGDGWLAFRTERWALARATTVPRDHLFWFARVIQEKRAANFDTMAKFVSGLTTPQVTRGTLPEVLAALSLLIEVDRSSLAFCRGWVALRKVLPLGATEFDLRWGMLPAETKAEWSRFLLLHGVRDTSPYDLTTYFARGSEIGMPLPRQGGEEQARLDHEMTQVLPNGVPSGALLHLEIRSLEGVAAAVGASVRESCYTVDAFGRLWVLLWAERQERYGRNLRPATLELMRLDLALPNSATVRLVFGGSSVDTSVKPGPLEALPGDVRQRLQRAIEAERARRTPPPRH